MTMLAAIALALAVPAVAQRYGGEGGYDRQARCQQLEQQLVTDWRQGQDPRAAAQSIAQQMEGIARGVRQAEADAERRDCYEDMFIFGRSLRRTRECVDLDRQIERGKRQLADLRDQREGLSRSSSRIREDDLIEQLARAGCGANYTREANARQRAASPRDFFSSFWQDEDSGPNRDDFYGGAREQRALPFATFRTLCVRRCDGYYFPISFSTIQSRLGEDAARCTASCAAPAELYVYRNPGEQVEQMANLDGVPYSSMPNAFRNRKHYIRGCSCKVEEFSPEEIARSEDVIREAALKGPAAAVPGAPGVVQDAAPAPLPAAPQPAAPADVYDAPSAGRPDDTRSGAPAGEGWAPLR